MFIGTFTVHLLLLMRKDAVKKNIDHRLEAGVEFKMKGTTQGAKVISAIA